MSDGEYYEGSSSSEDEDPCPEGKVFLEYETDATCAWNAKYEGWCCDKPKPTKLELIFQTCQEDQDLKDWRTARRRCHILWRTNHEKLTWGRENSEFTEPEGQCIILSSRFQTIMDFYMGQATYSHWAADALHNYENFSGGYGTAEHYKEEKEAGNIEFLRELSCLALIISHFFHVMKERASHALVAESANKQNLFIKALRETASSALDFYEVNKDRVDFAELYEEIQTNWERIKPPRKNQGLYIQDIENFTPDVIDRCYTFIMGIVRKTCEIDPSK
tara:strand:- start:244 stop:1074 length:831 start_codon:yes stop_codon:yes gene_type:complete